MLLLRVVLGENPRVHFEGRRRKIDLLLIVVLCAQLCPFGFSSRWCNGNCVFPVVGCTISEELFFEGKMVLSSVASGFIAMFSKFRFLSCNGFFAGKLCCNLEKVLTKRL